MNISKKIASILILQLFGWAIITYWDYCSENDMIRSDNYLALAIIGGTILITGVYLYMKIKQDFSYSLRTNLPDVAAWVLGGIGFTILVMALMENDLWLVPQATGGWEHFLNGIEYFLFGAFLTIVTGGVSLVYALGLFTYRKIKDRQLAKQQLAEEQNTENN